MASFKWTGHSVPVRLDGGLIDMPVEKIVLKKQDGSRVEFFPANPSGFVVDESLGEIADPRCVRMLRNDPRFAEEV